MTTGGAGMEAMIGVGTMIGIGITTGTATGGAEV
jgi:hypothetical protein